MEVGIKQHDCKLPPQNLSSGPRRGFLSNGHWKNANVDPSPPHLSLSCMESECSPPHNSSPWLHARASFCEQTETIIRPRNPCFSALVISREPITPTPMEPASLSQAFWNPYWVTLRWPVRGGLHITSERMTRKWLQEKRIKPSQWVVKLIWAQVSAVPVPQKGCSPPPLFLWWRPTAFIKGREMAPHFRRDSREAGIL